MPLKNYTSTVPASRSISFIENKLVSCGARDIMKRYDPEARVESIMFMININGTDVPFRLPARIDACEKVMIGELSSRARPETRKKIPAQAERTAWKIVSDWVEAQMAMIELAQVDFMEVMLPYVYDGKQSFYDRMKSEGFKLLGHSK